MWIRRALRFAGPQSKLLHDLFDETTFLQDASVGEQQKHLGLHIVDNAAPRKFLVFNVARNQRRHLHLLPAVNVPPWMIFAVAIRFGVIYRRSIKN
jgi:hypothetical protein